MAGVGFTGLTMTVQPVVLNTGTDAAPVYSLNTAGIPAGAVVAGILDPVNGINRMYNPTSVGYTPTATDAVGKWLPAVTSAGLTATTIQDNYWTPATGSAGANKFGQVSLNLTAGTSDAVRASSVMNFKLSQNAFVIVASGTFS